MVSESILTPAEGEESGVSIELYKERSINTLWIMIRDGRRYMLKGLNVARRTHQQEVARLRKEYSLGVRLNHPGIASTYAFEDHNITGPVIVTEYVDGKTLGEFLVASPDYRVRLRIAKELGDALAYIHQLGLAHRDLKPDNILIERRRNGVKLIDFGLADSDDSVIYKRSMATREFGAPEQQSPSETDASADIYSYGKILKLLLPERKFKKLIAKMLREDPAMRPTMPETLKELGMIEAGSKTSRWIVSLVVVGLICGVAGTFLVTREEKNEAPALQNEVEVEPAITETLHEPVVTGRSSDKEVSFDKGVTLDKEESKYEISDKEMSSEEVLNKYLAQQDVIFKRYGRLEFLPVNDSRYNPEVEIKRNKRYEEMGELAKVTERELKRHGVSDSKIAELLNSFWTGYVFKMNEIDGVNEAAGKVQQVIDSVNRALEQLNREM